MKKKILIISILFVFLLTGCKTKYSLKIKDGVIKETIRMVENSDAENVIEKDEFGHSFYDYSKMYGEEKNLATSFDEFYAMTECSSDCSFYQKNFINDNGIIGFELTHEFKFDEYLSSSFAKEMIPAFYSSYDGRYLKISGGPNWNYFDSYPDLEEIDFSIETDYKVVSTNLKENKDGIYQKTIKKDDSKIYITLDTSIVNEIDKNENGFLIFLIVFGGVLLVALVACVISNRKKYE